MNGEDEFVRAPPTSGGGSPRPGVGRRRWQLGVSVGLFFLTLVSACWAYAVMRTGASFWAPLAHPSLLLVGWEFAATLLVILLAHEMGHFLTARRHGVDQSPPFFIPAPTIFGTFGALILMRSRPPNRRVLLRVAVMGPYGGLLLAIPAAAWGLAHSVPYDPRVLAASDSLSFGSSILFHLLEQLFSPNGTYVAMHPVALAGWVGLFVTSLNLIPAAQLDGGHIMYALFGRRHERLSLAVVVILLALGLFVHLFPEVGPHGASAGGTRTGEASGGELWIFWALLLFVIGIRHPPVEDERAPLNRGDRLNGLFALVILVLTFVPVPVKYVPAAHVVEPRPGQQGQDGFFDSQPLELPPARTAPYEEGNGRVPEEFDL